MHIVEGTRVQIAPHTDRWMRGDRYGTVVTTPRDTLATVFVKFDRSGQTVGVGRDNLTVVDNWL